jgi:radical SAM-linked protein
MMAEPEATPEARQPQAPQPLPGGRRLRVRFATDQSVKYVGHLDMARTWERAIRRSGLPLAYSQGFNPQPRIHFAAALPLGYTGDAEVMDIYLNVAVEPEEAVRRLRAALPAGIIPLHAEEAPREWPALQAQVCRAHYRVEVETAESDAAFRARLDAFMARAEAWRERRRGKEVSRYDLRPLVLKLHLTGRGPLGQGFEVEMRNEPGATGRPDELLAELGYGEAARQIARTRLIFTGQEEPCGS